MLCSDLICHTGERSQVRKSVVKRIATQRFLKNPKSRLPSAIPATTRLLFAAAAAMRPSHPGSGYPATQGDNGRDGGTKRAERRLLKGPLHTGSNNFTSFGTKSP